MRNTRKSGQILRTKKRPRPTPRSGRGSRTNFHTSHQIPARVIEADSAHAVWVPDPRAVQLIQPGAAAAVITVSLQLVRGDRNTFQQSSKPYEERDHVQRFSVQCVRPVLRGPE